MRDSATAEINVDGKNSASNVIGTNYVNLYGRGKLTITTTNPASDGTAKVVNNEPYLAAPYSVTAGGWDQANVIYSVIVNSGSADLTTAAKGDTVTITADSAPSGQVFDKWTTEDGVTFANANDSTTTFEMPAKAVTVTATYKNDPNMDTELKNIKAKIATPSILWEDVTLTPTYDKTTRTYALDIGTDYNTIDFELYPEVSGQDVIANVDGADLTVSSEWYRFKTDHHNFTKATTVFVFTVTAKDGVTPVL